MTTITIPKTEYNNLLRIKRNGIIKALTLTNKQKQLVNQSFKEIKNGDYFTLNELKKYLGNQHTQKNR